MPSAAHLSQPSATKPLNIPAALSEIDRSRTVRSDAIETRIGLFMRTLGDGPFAAVPSTQLC